MTAAPADPVRRSVDWIYGGVWGVLTRWFRVTPDPPELPSATNAPPVSMRPADGFLNYQQQSFGQDEIVQTSWYPSTLWGLSLQVHIFSSGMRARQVEQASLTMQQAEVNLKATEQRLLTGQLQQKAVLSAAQESYTTGKASLALSKRIFEQTSAKFSEGMASSFELTQEHASYLTAQQTYIQRVVDLLQARVDMRKALDLF